MIPNSATLANLFRGFKTAFFRGMNSDERIYWQALAMLVRSTGAAEDYSWIGEIPSMREWIGPRQIQRFQAYSYALVNKKFELTMGVLRDNIDDDLVGTYGTRSELMGTAARVWPDEQVFAAIEAGETATCHDDQNFFDTDHPVGRDAAVTTASNHLNDGGTNSAHPWYLLDTTKLIKPFIWQLREDPEFVSLTNLTDVNVFMQDEYLFGARSRGVAGYGLWQLAQKNEGALSNDVVEAGILAMNELVNDEGRNLGIDPNILLVSYTHKHEAQKLVNKMYDNASTTDAVPNAPTSKLTVIASHRLT